VSSEKRRRQKANRAAKREAKQAAAQPIPELTDDLLAGLLADTVVRADCEHAATRTTPDGPVLTRCARGLDVGGGCPRDCIGFEARRIGGLGTGT
jgi:hypothetical protein